jgi:hypothetical protein
MSEFTDYCLRFPDEQMAFVAAQSLDAVVTTEDGPRVVRFTQRYAIDVIGIIVLPATYDEQGNKLTDPIILDGWHVNLRIIDGSDIPSDLVQYVITPAHPVRVWA